MKGCKQFQLWSVVHISKNKMWNLNLQTSPVTQLPQIDDMSSLIEQNNLLFLGNPRFTLQHSFNLLASIFSWPKIVRTQRNCPTTTSWNHLVYSYSNVLLHPHEFQHQSWSLHRLHYNSQLLFILITAMILQDWWRFLSWGWRRTGNINGFEFSCVGWMNCIWKAWIFGRFCWV